MVDIVTRNHFSDIANMSAAWRAAALALCLAAGLLVSCCRAQSEAGEWRLGRVTYYGAPASVARAYDPSRGEGSFGILAYGSCGYTNSDGSLPFPRDQPAATADASPDFPGSCGRCYEIRCNNSPALNNQGTPVKILNSSVGPAFEGDKFRPELEAIDATVKDTQGRPYPGNPLRAQGEMLAKCYDTNEVHLIRITDSCPCTQVLKESAPGVAAGGETRKQAWCCQLSGKLQQHFDISYYAFEKLVHPVYGVAMIDWRPVDCDTRQPLRFDPPYIDKSTIYKGGPRPGWAWFPQKSSAATLITPGAPTPSGSASTCLTMSPGGGLSFRCRECYRSGFQPFAGASSISFWIRSNAATTSEFESSAPKGTLPNLKMFMRKTESNRYCKNEPTTNSTAPVQTAGEWFRLTVPMSAFDCPGAGLSLADVDQFDWENTAERNAPVCIGDVSIDR